MQRKSASGTRSDEYVCNNTRESDFFPSLALSGKRKHRLRKVASFERSEEAICSQNLHPWPPSYYLTLSLSTLSEDFEHILLSTVHTILKIAEFNAE